MKKKSNKVIWITALIALCVFGVLVILLNLQNYAPGHGKISGDSLGVVRLDRIFGWIWT